LIELSEHGAMRMAQRLGKRKDRGRNKAKMAFLDGVPREKLFGELRDWVDQKFFKHERTRVCKVYRGVLYVFSDKNVLITCIPVPQKMYIRAKQGENRKKKRL
jgi:hypothetical protein